jgi:valyl-tRNA synthetase
LKDWTISRQLWWGHQIPAWYDENGNTFVARTYEEAVSQQLAVSSQQSALRQDEDVLDTWFSSALWAFSTFGWNGEITETDDLNTFCPTDVLVTGRDIIFLWVSRMMMTTKKFVDKKAFKDVLVTGTVLGKDGKPMSKSRGNGVDPLEMFDKFGVDATRIYLASIATGADIRWNDLLIETYRNFANKIWNATRFCLLNSAGATVDYSSLENPTSIADKWIISRLNQTAINVNKSLEKYEFHTAVSLLYHFFWDDFCDWYIELVKDEITFSSDSVGNDEDDLSVMQASASQIESRTRIITILESALRMLHPFMPYLTEELWFKLPNTGKHLHNSAYQTAEPTIMLSDFPLGNASQIDEKAESEMNLVIELISKIRNVRAEMQIKPSDRISIHVAANDETNRILSENEAQILKLARADKLNLSNSLDVPKASAKAVITGGAEIAVPLEGLIDFEQERNRLGNQINKLDVELQRLNGQLSNANFVDKAPAEKVAGIRERVSEIETQMKALKLNLEALG